VRPAQYDDEVRREREAELEEAARTGNCPLDINADWIDYAAAGVGDRDALDARIAQLLAVVDLEETVFELGLRGAADTRKNSTLAERVLEARVRLRERLASLGIQDWVERFDPDKYNRNATLAENLLFGTPVGRAFDTEDLTANAYVRRVLHDTGLYELLLRTGHKVAETMVELFSDLPPGHNSSRSTASSARTTCRNTKRSCSAWRARTEGDRRGERLALISLTFKLIADRHRWD